MTNSKTLILRKLKASGIRNKIRVQLEELQKSRCYEVAEDLAYVEQLRTLKLLNYQK